LGFVLVDELEVVFAEDLGDESWGYSGVKSVTFEEERGASQATH
jgi:hypothetical protein